MWCVNIQLSSAAESREVGTNVGREVGKLEGTGSASGVSNVLAFAKLIIKSKEKNI